MAVLPMFPLGTVLFPHVILPLRIFEPRYRQMVTELLVGDGEFGITLIERGSEVGGGDTRNSIGTRARIVHASENPDGTWFVAALGLERIRITTWLPDAPYPQADVASWPDSPPVADPGDMVAAVGSLRRLLALRSELGDATVASTVELDRDEVVALWQVCALLPVGPLDDQRLLAAPGRAARRVLIEEMLADETAVALQRLGS
jgi:uncharacterized protein